MIFTEMKMKQTLGDVGGHKLSPNIGVKLFVELLKTALLSLYEKNSLEEFGKKKLKSREYFLKGGYLHVDRVPPDT